MAMATATEAETETRVAPTVVRAPRRAHQRGAPATEYPMTYIGQNIPHDSARGHVTGHSVFIDDMPPQRNELLVEVVGSPVAHGRITSVDVSAARKTPGVIAVLTADDVTGHNKFG